MPVRRNIPYKEGLYFITFTCFRWLPLIRQTLAYDLVYKWFEYLKVNNHRIVGYVIMPNHLHLLIDFCRSDKPINRIIGDGKRFIAYEIVKRLEKMNESGTLSRLARAVRSGEREKGKRHEIWKESFDWKYCESAAFAYQKLVYIHNNPCAGKWKLAKDIMAYEHSSASYYISGRHSMYSVTDLEIILLERKEKGRPESNG